MLEKKLEISGKKPGYTVRDFSSNLGKRKRHLSYYFYSYKKE